mgnify:FL=1|jgi:hypothetical protein
MNVASNQIENIWIRVGDAVTLSGISRSGLYELFDSKGGPIKTSNIRSRGKTRGIRLINKHSLLEFIESCSCVNQA